MGVASGGKQTTYTRDVQNRITSRTQKTNGTVSSTVNYGFTGSGDTPDYLLDGGGNLIQKYVTLPGDVLLTVKTNSQSTGATTYSLPNIHGDVSATINADGSLLSTFMTGPFGEVLPTQPAQPSGALIPMPNPTNTADGTTYQYVGQHEKLSDLDTSPISGGITQMGARVYLPTLGRFASVDPVEGGTPNNYDYALDPVNESDLSGQCVGPALLLCVAFVAAVSVATASQQYQKNPTTANLIGAGLSIAAPVSGGSTGVRTIANKTYGQVLKNGNNVLRLGGGRLSVGAAPKVYKQLPMWQKFTNPIHVHYEPNRYVIKKVGIDFNYIKKSYYYPKAKKGR